jgi:hypothetical protein
MDSVKTKVEKGNKGVASLCLRNDMPTKLLTIVLLVPTFTLTSFAQVSFGVKAGVNFSDSYFKNRPSGIPASAFETETALGFHVGLFGSIKLTDKFYFNPELQFAQRGTSSSSKTYSINYLELPLILSYSVHKSISFDFGINPSYRLPSTVDAYKDFDFGAIGGARVRLNKDFFIVARYYYGFLAISEIDYRNSKNVIITTTTQHSQSFQFSVGYKIK